jgi:hypothetical protein
MPGFEAARTVVLNQSLAAGAMVLRVKEPEIATLEVLAPGHWVTVQATTWSLAKGLETKHHTVQFVKTDKGWRGEDGRLY